MNENKWSKIPYFSIIISVLLVILHILRMAISPIFPEFNWGLITFIDFFNGEIYGIFTYAFMHFTWIHLVFNISQIILFGYILEKKLKLYEFLGLFFISIIIGGILSLIMVGFLDPQWTFMGSSGFGNGFLGCAWILKMKKVQKKFYNSLWFYFYLLATIFYAILPIINVIFVLDNISYILLNVGIMFIHLLCVLVGIIYGHFIYKRIKSRNTIENHKK